MLQTLDGLLTYVGVSRFGLYAEGNVLMRWCFAHFGLAQSIVAIKSSVMMFTAMLIPTRRWVALATLYLANVTYVVLAVVPWVFLLWMVK